MSISLKGISNKVNHSVILSHQVFSGGEVHLSIPKALRDYDSIEVTAKLSNSEDVMALIMITNAIKHFKVWHSTKLIMPYIPYARQDRVCNIGEAHGAQAFAQIINSLKYDEVVVADSHSDVATTLLENVVEITQVDIFESSDLLKNLAKDSVIIAPDGGAMKKAFKIAQEFGGMIGLGLVTAEKIRDTNSGNILHTKVNGDVDGKDVLIVDDICDGGRTFIELAKTLREQGATRISLYVTHGIFSKGLDVLFEHLDTIVTTDAFESKVVDSKPWSKEEAMKNRGKMFTTVGLDKVEIRSKLDW